MRNFEISKDRSWGTISEKSQNLISEPFPKLQNKKEVQFRDISFSTTQLQTQQLNCLHNFASRARVYTRRKIAIKLQAVQIDINLIFGRTQTPKRLNNYLLYFMQKYKDYLYLAIF
jgi:hypothetical protein